jgi:hypothetical protein
MSGRFDRRPRERGGHPGRLARVQDRGHQARYGAWRGGWDGPADQGCVGKLSASRTVIAEAAEVPQQVKEGPCGGGMLVEWES